VTTVVAARLQGRAPGGRADARPWTPRASSASLTSIFFAALCAGFGIVIVRTPLDIVACTFDELMPEGVGAPDRTHRSCAPDMVFLALSSSLVSNFSHTNGQQVVFDGDIDVLALKSGRSTLISISYRSRSHRGSAST